LNAASLHVSDLLLMQGYASLSRLFEKRSHAHLQQFMLIFRCKLLILLGVDGRRAENVVPRMGDILLDLS
jgi:hypothetical protein